MSELDRIPPATDMPTTVMRLTAVERLLNNMREAVTEERNSVVMLHRGDVEPAYVADCRQKGYEVSVSRRPAVPPPGSTRVQMMLQIKISWSPSPPLWGSFNEVNLYGSA
jgi:hypothetical protein